MSSDDSSHPSKFRRGCIAFIFGSAALYLLCAVASLVVMIYTLPRLLAQSKRAECQNNLKQIGIMLQFYRQDNGGAWPRTLLDLQLHDSSDLRVFICPASNDQTGPIDSIAEWSSYEYASSDNEGDPASIVICRDKEPSHIPAGKNELFADGHAAFKPYAEAPLH